MKFEVNITLTWSKIMAALILILAFTLDILSDKKGTVLMVAIPIAAGLIASKQINDRIKETK